MSDVEQVVTGAEAEDEFFELEQNIGNIPISDQDYKTIITYLSSEIATAISERENLETKWEKWRRQSEGRPEQISKDFPWKNASNVVVPLTMQNVNGIYSLLQATYEEKDPFWTVEDTSPMDIADEALQDLMNILAKSPDHLDLDNAASDAHYDLARMGTEFIHIPWVTDEYAFKGPDTSGAIQVYNVIRRDSPVVRALRIEDFVTRPHWSDPQKMPWFAIRYPFYEYELIQQQARGIFNDVDIVVNRGVEELDDEHQARLERAGIDISGESGVFYLYMVHYFYDIDGDDVPEDLILWIDPISQHCVRKELNTFGVRPIVRMPYINLPGQLYGMGICHISEHMQDEADALHNMRIDGTQLAMLQMYVTKTGSKDLGAIQFRPLLNIKVDDPSKDFQIVKFPDMGYTTLQAELMSKEYADRATGASDAMMGFESKSTSARTTASGTMFLANQGSRLFNAIRKNSEAAWSQVGQMVMYQLVREKERTISRLIPLVEESKQEALTELFNNLTVADIPERFKFHVAVTEAEKTEEVKRQHKLTLVQLYQMYGKNVLELAMLAGNPQIPPQAKELALKLYTGATNLMEDVFKFFGERDTSQYLPYIKDIELMQQMMAAMKDQQLAGALSGQQSSAGAMGPGRGRAAAAQGALGGPGIQGNQAPVPGGPGQIPTAPAEQ